MQTVNNPISHHTSHTLANGASSSSQGIHGNGGHSNHSRTSYTQGDAASSSNADIGGGGTHPIGHHSSHTLGHGASSSNKGAHENGENSNGNEHNQGGLLEASITHIATDLSNLTTKSPLSENGNSAKVSISEVSSSCPSAGSISCGSSSPGGRTVTAATSMCSSSSLSNFCIVDSTLREGEQFVIAHFDTAQKIEIARGLDDFGVEYIELTSPAASEQSRVDCEAICKLGLGAKILCHIRCHMDDAKIAVQTGVDGINMCIGTSSHLMKHSHGKDMAYIAAKATEVISHVQSNNIEIRFSGEDSFRSDFAEILELYSLMDGLGANRVGIADTVGGATPLEVFEKIHALRGTVGCDIETHFHNDTGCAVANAYVALDAGATHVDTSVLGIGERNGITPLGGLMASLIRKDRGYILGKYKVERLGWLEHLVAQTVGVEILFNNSAASLRESG